MRTVIVKRTDGGITILRTAPRVMIADDGTPFAILRMALQDNDMIRLYFNDAIAGEGPVWRIDIPRAVYEVGGPRFGYPPVDGEVDAQFAGSDLIAMSWREMPLSAIPADKTFRNAWCDVTPEPVIDIDMAKARDIHRENLRALRVPLLAALDESYLRADEQGNAQTKRDIAARKQALRDITADPAIEAAQTPEALKAVLPEALRTEMGANPSAIRRNVR